MSTFHNEFFKRSGLEHDALVADILEGSVTHSEPSPAARHHNRRYTEDEGVNVRVEHWCRRWRAL